MAGAADMLADLEALSDYDGSDDEAQKPAKRKREEDDIGDDDGEDDDEEHDDAGDAEAGGDAMDVEGETLTQEDLEAARQLEAKIKGATSVKSVSKLLSSKALTRLLEQIRRSQSMPRNAVIGPVEEDPDYQIVVDSNTMSVELENDIDSINKFIRTKYAKRFPEMDNLVLNAVDYARAVKMFGYEKDLTKVDLSSILPSATVMAVTLTATNTNGKPMLEEEISVVLEACEGLLTLQESRKEIVEFIESRMSIIAPNMVALVGSSVAAKLLSTAGGLSSFCKLPASVVQILGQAKKKLHGFSTATTISHVGFIEGCDIITFCPPSLKKKAVRLIANKLALAARVDSFHESQDAAQGKAFKAEIEHKIEKWNEPPPGKNIKALPAPVETTKKRRGGKRVRKQKEKFGVTELRRQANRVAFGEEEKEAAGYETSKGLGLIGSNSGRVRGAVADSRTKVKLQDSRVKKLVGPAGLKTPSGLASGLSSSLAFTPVQGMELVATNESREARIAEANAKWFGSSKGFKKQ